MKKYIAPEMEMTNFKTVDVLTTSGDTSPVKLVGTDSTDLSADKAIAFSDAYGGFNQ